MTEFLQNVLPEFLVGSLTDVLLAGLIVVALVYMILLGEFVYSERRPSDPMATVVCEFFAGTCYTTVVARFFSLATGVESSRRGARTVSILLFFVYSTTATFVATLRGEQQGKNSDVKFLPLWLVVERMLKGGLGVFVALFGQLRLGEAGGPAPPAIGPAPSLPGVPLLPPTEAGNQAVSDSRSGPIALILVAMVITFTHLLLLRRWRTCSITFVTRARVLLLSVAGWGQVVTLLMLCFGGGGWLVFLIVTVALWLGLVVCAAIYMVFFGEIPEDESDHVRKLRLLDARNKLLRRGVNRRGISVARGPRTMSVALPACLSAAATPAPPSTPPPGGVLLAPESERAMRTA